MDTFPAKPPDPKYKDLTPAKTAEKFGVTVRRINQLVEDGKLEEKEITTKEGKKFRVITEESIALYEKEQQDQKSVRDAKEAFLLETLAYPDSQFRIMNEYITNHDLMQRMISAKISISDVEKLLRMIRAENMVHFITPPVGSIVDNSGKWVNGPHTPSKITEEFRALPFAFPTKAPEHTEIPEAWNVLLDGWICDPEIAYKWIAGALLGLPSQKILYLWGPGGSGKSTFTEAIKFILGDMVFISTDSSRIADGDQYYLAQFEGRRVVAVVEHTKQNLGSIFKTLSGGDSITGRHPYGKVFTFKPTHRLIFTSNEQASFNDISSAFTRRIISVETKTPEQRDPLLLQKLQEQAPTFVTWIIKHYAATASDIECLANDIAAIPKDTAQIFLTEELDPDFVFDDLKAVYHKYKSWCDEDMGERPLNRQN
ncbi:MAG: hypothetical protein KGJ90_06230, partial [Patescibacteria group bacterium]|nr:hypothetical protein [Patescibacteria group bacterium]